MEYPKPTDVGGVEADTRHVSEEEARSALVVEPVETPPPNFVNTNPVVVGFGALVAAAIALLAAFGVAFTAEQIAAITGFVAVAVPFVLLFIRNKVTPLSDPKIDAEVRLVPESTNRV
jgi:hypothetical protein